MNKAKTSLEIAEQCHALLDSDTVTLFYNELELFRKACIADYVSQCEQVATIQTNGDSLYAFVRPSCSLELGTQLFTLPNDGE